VIAQLVEVEPGAFDPRADARAQRLDHRADLFRVQHAVHARAFDVEDLALQRQDRLDIAVAALLGGATGGVTFDNVEFG